MKINAAIEGALQTAQSEGIGGKETTPFLLAAIAELTSGRSLETSKSPNANTSNEINTNEKFPPRGYVCRQSSDSE